MAVFADAPVAINRGDTDFLDGAATKPDGTVQPLTGWTLEFLMKRRLGDADAAAVVRKTTTAGTVTVTDASQGFYTVPMLPADTNPLENRAQVFYGGVRGTDPLGEVNSLWDGLVTVNPSIRLT